MIQAKTEHHAKVIESYFHDELSLKDVMKIHGISRQRIYQILHANNIDTRLTKRFSPDKIKLVVEDYINDYLPIRLAPKHTTRGFYWFSAIFPWRQCKMILCLDRGKCQYVLLCINLDELILSNKLQKFQVSIDQNSDNFNASVPPSKSPTIFLPVKIGKVWSAVVHATPPVGYTCPERVGSSFRTACFVRQKIRRIYNNIYMINTCTSRSNVLL